MDQNESKRAFTVTTLSKAWDCSEGVIRRMIAEGQLKIFRIGNLIRILPEEVERFERRDSTADAELSDEVDMLFTDEPRMKIPRATRARRPF